MIITLISFKDGRLVESVPLDVMEKEDIKMSLAYAFLYNYTVNVYSDNRKFDNVKLLSIKYNEKGNLFFSGIYNDNNNAIRKNFSWREIHYIDVNIEREPEKSIY